MTSRQAARDLAKKIRLERKLKIEMRKILNTYANEMERALKDTGNIPNAISLTSEPTRVALLNQYNRVSKEFKKDFREEVAKSHPHILETKNIDDDIDENLDLFIAVSTVSRSSTIANTTQKETERAIIQATIAALEEELTSAELQATIAENAADKFRRGINARAELIATTETQNAAEGTKDIEVTTVARSPEVEGVEVITKEWETVIDGLERETHYDANGQTVNHTDAFLVGDSALLYAGDTSLGAELKEVVNCRCSIKYTNHGSRTSNG